MGTMLGIALFLLAAPVAAPAPAAGAADGTATGAVVLFVQGRTHSDTDLTLLVPVVCYRPTGGLVSAAASDCLSLVPRDAEVALDSGTTVRVSGREPATCTDDDGALTGESRDSLVVAGQLGNLSYAVWPATARARIRSIRHSPPDKQPDHAPAGELESVGKLVRRSAPGEVDVLQRFEDDLDGDGRPDVAYSVDVRCTKKQMRARAGDAEAEPWSCFNGLLVRWGGTTTFAVVAKEWDLGQIGAVFDLDGDRRPEVLVFSPLDDGERMQVFTVSKRKLDPLEPWCCGCRKQTRARCRSAPR